MTHLVSRISAVLLVLTMVGVAALAGVWGLDAPSSEANHAGGMTAISVDTNISGNDPDTLGPNNTCVSANAGASVTIDVTALGIPVSNPMIGWGYTLEYDPNIIAVSDFDANFLITVAPGSSIFIGTEPPPDTDGFYESGVLDINVDAAEFGSGVLERLTLDISGATSPGLYDLTLTVALHIDRDNVSHAADNLRSAIVAVGQPCPTGAGDVDCSDTVNSVDALKILRHNASLSVSQNDPCVDIGQSLGSRDQGDVDCNGSVNSVDALKVLRAVAGLTAQQEAGCPPIMS